MKKMILHHCLYNLSWAELGCLPKIVARRLIAALLVTALCQILFKLGLLGIIKGIRTWN